MKNLNLFTMVLFLLISSCAHNTQNNNKNNQDQENNNRFSVTIPDVQERTKTEKFNKKFLGKRGEIFVDFYYSNTGKYLLKVKKIPDSLLELNNIKATLSIESQRNPAVVTFANDGEGSLSSFGPYLTKGTELHLKIIFMDEKIDYNFNFRL